MPSSSFQSGVHFPLFSADAFWRSGGRKKKKGRRSFTKKEEEETPSRGGSNGGGGAVWEVEENWVNFKMRFAVCQCEEHVGKARP